MRNITATWKEQPVGSTWTKEQWQAIAARGEDILVAAAAGSGKTAVLVNRIIQRIIDEQEALDVDRLLVVTFTNAAAAEMRKRIGEALEQELKERPSSLHLRRQLNLLPRASISTLHSFCLEVIRQYYYQLDLDPHFRIADETEAALLREEVLEELFEEEYSKQEQTSFYELVDRYSGDRSDLDLQQLVLKLYDFSRSTPWPDLWLQQMAAGYLLPEEEQQGIDDLPWAAEILQDIRLQLQGMLELVEKAIQIAQSPQGPTPYLSNLAEDKLLLERLFAASEQSPAFQSSWRELYHAFQDLPFGRLKPCKQEDILPELQEKVKDIRESIKKQVKGIQEEYFLRSPEAYLQDLREMAPYLFALVELVQKFAQRYEQKKLSKAMVDFADLEHYCLQILGERTFSFQQGEQLADFSPTKAALLYRQKYAEVLVDEYQDTNMVQEAIIRLVSKGTGQTGNRFMVGDVKQSIYRFRLAEPSLFISKYKRFAALRLATEQVGEEQPELSVERPGLRIDLAMNFRSRKEVLAATNFIFKQIMDEQVGELEYDQDAQLIWGAKEYPETERVQAELLLIRRDGENQAGEDEERADQEEDGEGSTALTAESLAAEELETVQLEARLIASKIKALIGKTEQQPFQVYDQKLRKMRPATYRDMVILLRATSAWAPVMLDELKQHGIPAYAELQTGYFEAIEVAVIMSLLKVIDNPYQDIPLASVLRSPIVGLSGEELAQIRLADKNASYYEALKVYLQRDDWSQEEKTNNEPLYQKLFHFYRQLQRWRSKARHGALADLIWQVYRETGYYDFVSGMVGGNQRQANLRALYDRAKQYETTSFRGLFRFLRFIEKMQERGGDLGTARALGEQEDVVRIMTIHKSKGLEFPIVFVAGLAKSFNLRDAVQPFLLHKELGLGTRYVDPKLRVTYPTLPQMAIKKRMHMELLAEEMRILYVALTRAKEKLYLLATCKNLLKEVGKWLGQASATSWLLPAYERSKAKCYLDWIGAAIVRHRAGEKLHQLLEEGANFGSVAVADKEGAAFEVYNHPSQWQITVYEASSFQQLGQEEKKEEEGIIKAIQELKPIPLHSSWQGKIKKQLNWSYAYPAAARHRAKQSVTEIKREREKRDEATDDRLLKQNKIYTASMVERPRFMQAKKLTAGERGTVMHMVMQHADFSQEMTIERLELQLKEMLEKEFFTIEQSNAIDLEQIISFFHSPLGQRMSRARKIEREIPFSLALAAEEVYADWSSREQEAVLVQGVIDSLFEEDDGGLVLVDYKSDSIKELLESEEETAKRKLIARYKVQVELYERAVKQIWNRELKEKYLYFFEMNYCLPM